MNMNLKDSVFWFLQVSEKVVEDIKMIEADYGVNCTLGTLQQAVAKMEVLRYIIDEAGLNDEYRHWCQERSGLL